MLVVGLEGGHFPSGLIIASAFWGAIYYLFAYGYSDDADSCITGTGDDIIEEFPYIDDGIVTDVGDRFTKFFKAGFYLYAIQVACGILSHVVNSNYDMLRLLTNIYHWTNICCALLFILGLFFRFMHSGRVCSGDFSDDSSNGMYLFQ